MAHLQRSGRRTAILRLDLATRTEVSSRHRGNLRAVRQKRVRPCAQLVVPVLEADGLLQDKAQIIRPESSTARRTTSASLRPSASASMAATISDGHRHPRDGSPDELRLFRIRLAPDRRIAGAIVRKQNRMGQRVDRAFHENEPVIVRQSMRQPQGLTAAGGEAGEAGILQLIAAKPSRSKCGNTALPRASMRTRPAKRLELKQRRGQSAFIFKIGMPGRIPASWQTRFRRASDPWRFSEGQGSRGREQGVDRSTA